MGFDPNEYGALQWVLDSDVGSGEAYYPDLVEGLAVLRPLNDHGDVRANRGQTCYLFDGVLSYIAVPGLIGTESIANDGPAVLTVSAGRIDCAAGGKAWNIQIDGGAFAVYYGNEEADANAYDSTGNANHGVITSANLLTFHATDPAVLSNPANEVGHTDKQPGILPRNEAIPSEDINGNPLEYSGLAPNLIAIETPLGTFDGVASYLSIPSLIGTETITSYYGTGTPSISAGRIDCTAGTLGGVVLSNGAVYTFSEGSGNTVHNVTANADHGTITSATLLDFWADRIGSARDQGIEHGGRNAAAFDGVDDYVELPAAIPALLSISNDWTLVISVNTNGGSTYVLSSRFGSNDGITISLASFQVRAHVSYASGGTAFSVSSTDSVTIGERSRIVVSWSSSSQTARLWVDGVEQFGTSTGAAAVDFTAYVGRYRETTPLTFDGAISDLAFYEAELTPETLANPTSAYPFDDNFGTNIEDVIGDNDGTLSNANDSQFWQFVPGLNDGSSAADGEPLTLTPGYFCNNASRLIYDPWTSPELVGLGLPAESTVGQLLRNVEPIGTKFRSEVVGEFTGPGFDDGQSFADGDNRIFNVPESPGIEGQELAIAIAYLDRTLNPDLVSGWLMPATHIVQSVKT